MTARVVMFRDYAPPRRAAARFSEEPCEVIVLPVIKIASIANEYVQKWRSDVLADGIEGDSRP